MDDVFEAFRNCITDGKCINKPCVYENKCQIKNKKDQFVEIPKHLALDVLNRMKEQSEIVQCKDCQYRHTNNCIAEEAGLANVPDDFFCADGERNEK